MFPWAASGRAQAVGRTDGLTKWLIDPQTERVLGCGIVGYTAGDLIAEAVLAIEMAIGPGRYGNNPSPPDFFRNPRRGRRNILRHGDRYLQGKGQLTS